MKLVSVSFKVIPRLPGMRPGDLINIQCDKPGEALRDWKISIRGQQVFFISPRGWIRDQNMKRDPQGPVAVFEMPRGEMYFQWEANADELEMLYKGGKFETPPLGWMPEPIVADKPLLAQIPSSQMGDA